VSIIGHAAVSDQMYQHGLDVEAPGCVWHLQSPPGAVAGSQMTWLHAGTVR
jgi:hypothetical protein